MIHHLRGTIEKKDISSVVVDVGGLGYAVAVPLSTFEKLPAAGGEAKLFIVESVAMYGGNVTLYGFLSEAERDVFSLLKEEVPGAGAKKALDYLDKVAKSLPDFRHAVINKDAAALMGIFGFTRKTADKLIGALKEKIGAVALSGKEKFVPVPVSTSHGEAIAGLVALGYREMEAREAVEKIGGGASLTAEELIRKALRRL